MSELSEYKNRLIFIMFSTVVGAVIGGIIWAFMNVMHLLIELIWDYIPSNIYVPGYTIIICLIGGVIIGLIQKHYGPCPDDLHQVMKRYKQDGRYPYNNVFPMLITALMPLVFGGAIGPEAGLTGVIVGLCCWAGDNFKYAGKTLTELSDIGVSATLAVLFRSPLFGFIEPLEGSEDDFVLPKTSKLTAIFCAILSGVGIFALLGSLFASGVGLPRFEEVTIGNNELVYALPILIIGIALGYVYKIFERLSVKASELLGKRYFLSAIIAALILGVMGTIFPLAMFSGEEEIAKLGNTYLEYTPVMLFAITLAKVFLINICINLGWRGGSFFPLIFAGVCLGYACAMLFGIDIAFAVSISTAAAMTTIMRKPLAVSVLLLLCFPASSIIYVLAAAFISSVVPMPKALSKN